MFCKIINPSFYFFPSMLEIKRESDRKQNDYLVIAAKFCYHLNYKLSIKRVHFQGRCSSFFLFHEMGMICQPRMFFQSRARDSTSHCVGLSVGRSVPLYFFFAFLRSLRVDKCRLMYFMSVRQQFGPFCLIFCLIWWIFYRPVGLSHFTFFAFLRSLRVDKCRLMYFMSVRQQFESFCLIFCLIWKIFHRPVCLSACPKFHFLRFSQHCKGQKA